MIAPRFMLAGGGHVFKDISIPMIHQDFTSKRGIVIEDDVWIGANSVVVEGVRIWKCAVIVAGSIVVNNVTHMRLYVVYLKKN